MEGKKRIKLHEIMNILKMNENNISENLSYSIAKKEIDPTWRPIYDRWQFQISKPILALLGLNFPISLIDAEILVIERRNLRKP